MADIQVIQGTLLKAIAAIILHVGHYNATAQLEHRTRVFTKVSQASFHGTESS
jgi:hypothetical protein